MSWIPFKNSVSKSVLPIYPLSAQSFPLILFRKFPCFVGSLSSTSAAVNMKLSISPLSLIIRCDLNPKNHSMEHFPRMANPSNILWLWILWFLQTYKGVESTKLIPVHVSSNTVLMNIYGQRKQYFFFLFNETIVRDSSREQMGQMLTYIFLIKVLETWVSSRMKKNHDKHNFCIAHAIGLVTMLSVLFCIFQHVILLISCKFFAEIICQTINFSNFSLGEHSGNGLNVIIGH